MIAVPPESSVPRVPMGGLLFLRPPPFPIFSLFSGGPFYRPFPFPSAPTPARLRSLEVFCRFLFSLFSDPPGRFKSPTRLFPPSLPPRYSPYLPHPRGTHGLSARAHSIGMQESASRFVPECLPDVGIDALTSLSPEERDRGKRKKGVGKNDEGKKEQRQQGA